MSRPHYHPARAKALRTVLTPREMQAADRYTIETLGLDGIALMESAGRQVADRVDHHARPGDAVAIFMGRGNNGGDGAVVARYLVGRGYDVSLWLCADPAGVIGDARTNLTVCERLGLSIHRVESQNDLPTFEQAQVVIDALLGTGLRGDPRGALALAIQWINDWSARTRGPVIAVDVPSGVSGLTGRAGTPSVQASETVTFAASKLGHWLYPGASQVGTLQVVDIGIPDEAIEAALRQLGGHRRWVLGPETLAPAFVSRAPYSHKGSYGTLAVIGGSPGRTGAARMALDAALRSGVGRVTLLTDPRVEAPLAAQAYEAMVKAGWSDEAGVAQITASLSTQIRGSSALVLGPGLADDVAARVDWPQWLSTIPTPVLIDATGLDGLRGRLEMLNDGGPRVITPHPGEAGRMLGVTASKVQSDRLRALIQLMEKTGAVVVLKGAHTLVGDPEAGIAVCPVGNPGMAVGGSGDVLSGIIGALLARGLNAGEAARAGVYWHARAGDLAAARLTEGSLLPRDMIQSLIEVERQEAECSHD
ncbi:MAG: NAD(P)H-hydrate dehydratase [Bradymonadia bacterium]